MIKIRIVLKVSNQETTYEIIAIAELLESIDLKDVQVGVYRVGVSSGESVGQEKIYTNNIELVKEHLVINLKKVLNELNT